MAKWLDDFLFYLPGFASVPIVIVGMLAVWLIWRMMKRRSKPGVPPFPPTSVGDDQKKK
jgi:hypothetical protein